MDAVLEKGRTNAKLYTRSRKKCQPALYFTPHNIEDVKQIISVAFVSEKKVRVTGNERTISDRSVSCDFLLSLQHLCNIIQVDEANNTVTVETGIYLHVLESKLQEYNLSLPIHPVPYNTCLAEAFATGVHGSGCGYFILPHYVTRITFVSGTGELQTLSKDSNEGKDELFQTVCMDLHTTAVVVQVTLQCQKRVEITTTSYGLQLKDLLENIDVHIGSSEHFYFDWYPHTESVIVHHARHIPPGQHVQAKRHWLWGSNIWSYILQLLHKTSYWFPILLRYIHRWTYTINKKQQSSGYSIPWQDYMHYANNVEWFFPRSRTSLVLFELEQWILQHKYHLQSPIRVSFIKADDLPLSPTGNTDATSVIIPQIHLEANPLADACAKIMKSAEGRPPLLKVPCSVKKDIPSLYPILKTYNLHRERLDPKDIFLHTDMKRVLLKFE